MMRLPCAIVHRKWLGPWRVAQEVPIWRGYGAFAAGSQPTHFVIIYQTRGVRGRQEPDQTYVLAGKLIEQVRACAECGWVEYRWQRVTV